MKKYVCKICGYEYDPEKGDPSQGIYPGTPFDELPASWKCPKCKNAYIMNVAYFRTAFEDIPEDWACPLCGVGKDDFEPVE